ncbi:MAG: hypothetical protein PVH87_28515, partial [Desulfobacteraceae bacterium]
CFPKRAIKYYGFDVFLNLVKIRNQKKHPIKIFRYHKRFVSKPENIADAYRDGRKTIEDEIS